MVRRAYLICEVIHVEKIFEDVDNQNSILKFLLKSRNENSPMLRDLPQRFKQPEGY